MKLLTDEELAAALERLPEWKLDGGKLQREWHFESFVQAMRFVNQAALIAEVADHHPDIDVRYNVVRLGLVTHSAKGITVKDVEMAEKLRTVSGD